MEKKAACNVYVDFDSETIIVSPAETLCYIRLEFMTGGSSLVTRSENTTYRTKAGESIDVTADVVGRGGEPVPLTDPFEYSVSDPSVLKVEQEGNRFKITCLNPGEARVVLKASPDMKCPDPDVQSVIHVQVS